ncbi:hypothetical protein SADUNF_Sadunf08G0013100 [Salix dunnii]|uniref:Uncharacterized protein n=1 Tax=Salix dunnii TaxID=1413687 RepID=A0A835JZG9_9ROSI|nr:hypothetical protein SADUNF_Sadunf08G0013100 [Salix dunnii]
MTDLSPMGSEKNTLTRGRHEDLEDGHATEQHEDLGPTSAISRDVRFAIRARGASRAVTVWIIHQVAGLMVLANAPVSAVLRKMRNKRSMAFTITKGILLQNPIYGCKVFEERWQGSKFGIKRN